MIELITRPVRWSHIEELAAQNFGDLVKAVVDVRTGALAVGGDMHADEEAFLLEQGSLQADLWGINLYPALQPNERIEFDSIINIRPSQGNRSRSVDDAALRQQIIEIMQQKIAD